MSRLLPLVTRDPITDEPLIVTRLEGPTSGIVIEGRFDLGWIGRLKPEQLDFVVLLLRHRTNLQKLAGEMGLAYNTVRSRLDEVVEALGEPTLIAIHHVSGAFGADESERLDVLDRLAAGEITVEDAVQELKS